MSFDAIETSVEEGRPVLFYQFTMGNLAWRYTAAEEPLTMNTYEWVPAAIMHDDIQQTGEPLNEMLTLTAPSWIGPAQVFMSAVPPRGVMLTLFEKHDQDPEALVVYVGEVSQISFPQPGACKIRCETLSASMSREGLRLAWQRSCPYAVYDPTTCKLDMESQASPFVVLGVSGNTLTVEFTTVPPDNKLNDGFLTWTHPVRGVEYMAIDAQIGSVMTLYGDPSEMVIGSTGKAYPTCALTPAACQAFGNYDNYGGVIDMPGKSPFDGLDSPFF